MNAVFVYATPKTHILGRKHVIWCILRRIRSTGLGYRWVWLIYLLT